MKKWMTAMLTALLFFTVFQNVNAYRLNGWKRIDLSSMGYQIGSNVDSTCRSTISSGISMWENTPYLEPEISFRESSSYSWHFSCNDFGNVNWSGLHFPSGSNGILKISTINMNTYYTKNYTTYARNAVMAI